MYQRIQCAVLSASLLFSGSMGWAQSAPPATPPSTRPAPTKPVLPPMTAEQKAVVAKYSTQPTDEPAPKMDLAAYKPDGTPNPNFGKENPGFIAMHERFLKRKQQPIGVLFLGDSITAGWGGGGKKVWESHYGKLDAANFGIGGDRTEHVLWRIANGELDGIKPKVVVLMIGTNNSGNTAENITKGVKAIVTQIHNKLPDSKLLLLGIFPRGPVAVEKDGKPNAGRAKLQAVNGELAKLDDGKQTRYLEIWKQFLNADGTLSPEIMPDYLHPNEKGYTIWADTMQPQLDEMMK